MIRALPRGARGNFKSPPMSGGGYELVDINSRRHAPPLALATLHSARAPASRRHAPRLTPPHAASRPHRPSARRVAAPRLSPARHPPLLTSAAPPTPTSSSSPLCRGVHAGFPPLWNIQPRGDLGSGFRNHRRRGMEAVHPHPSNCTTVRRCSWTTRRVACAGRNGDAECLPASVSEVGSRRTSEGGGPRASGRERSPEPSKNIPWDEALSPLRFLPLLDLLVVMLRLLRLMSLRTAIHADRRALVDHRAVLANKFGGHLQSTLDRAQIRVRREGRVLPLGERQFEGADGGIGDMGRI